MTHEKAIKEMQERIDIGKRCYPDMVQEYIEALKMGISAMERDRWIPVTENPKHDDTYLVTLDGEICGQDEPITSMCGYFDGKWDEESVLAWRPLPEPYHPQKLNNADEDTAQSGLQSAT